MNDQRYADPSEIRHQIGPDGRFSLKDVSGSIELRGADTDEVVVRASSQDGGSDTLPITVRKSGGALEIDVEKRSIGILASWFRDPNSIDFDVTVPRGARVDISSVSADIKSHFLRGEQAYRTVSGEIEIDPDGGHVRVTTVSGDVQVRPGNPVGLDVNSTSGDVQVKGAGLSTLEARTVSGDVRVEAEFAAGPLHSVETVSGDLSIRTPTGLTVDVRRGMDLSRNGTRGLVVGDGAAQLRYRTLSGDARVDGARRADRDERHAERKVPEPAPSAAAPSQPTGVDQLEVLRALERGEIDVEEASRRLQEV